jgi:two-component system sensor histidine kinase KdpD
MASTARSGGQALPRWPALVAWALAWVLMLVLDDHLDLANQAMLQVLAAAVASLWWGPVWSALSIVVGVLAFNFAFVPPRGTLSVDLHHHGLLLVVMVSVSAIVTALVARLRRMAQQAREHAQRSDELRRFGDALRESDDLLSGQAALRRILGRLYGEDAALLVRVVDAGMASADSVEHWFGRISSQDREALRRCMAEGRPAADLGEPHGHATAWCLPLRGRQRTHGAALVRLHTPPPAADLTPKRGLGAQDEHKTRDFPFGVQAWTARARRLLGWGASGGGDDAHGVQVPGLAAADPARLAHAQALCDQLGAALERAAAERAAARAMRESEVQAVRNTLLSAVAHDHRTPLATIISAAGALHDQSDRLDAGQRRRLSATIVDEARQLARITDNTLQLARLDTASLTIAKDWESMEELIGSVTSRVRQRLPGCALSVRIQPDLPLVRCDAVLLVQLIDNLVDNAIRHGGATGPVEVSAVTHAGQVKLCVEDRGPGFDPGPTAPVSPAGGGNGSTGGAVQARATSRRGAGVGLALCRAIARVHLGELTVQARDGGGARVAVLLPADPLPGAVPSATEVPA